MVIVMVDRSLAIAELRPSSSPLASRSHAFSGEEKAWGIAYIYATCSPGMFGCVIGDRKT